MLFYCDFSTPFLALAEAREWLVAQGWADDHDGAARLAKIAHWQEVDEETLGHPFYALTVEGVPHREQGRYGDRYEVDDLRVTHEGQDVTREPFVAAWLDLHLSTIAPTLAGHAEAYYSDPEPR